MKHVQVIFFFYWYFTKHVIPTNWSVSTLLYSLINQVNMYYFFYHRLGSQNYARHSEGHQPIKTQKPFTILSSRVTKMRPSPAQVSSVPATLSEKPTSLAPPLPNLGRIPAGLRSIQRSSWRSPESRALVIITAVLCPSWNGTLSRYVSFINIHLPKANSNHSWTSSSLE